MAVSRMGIYLEPYNSVLFMYPHIALESSARVRGTREKVIEHSLSWKWMKASVQLQLKKKYSPTPGLFSHDLRAMCGYSKRAEL